MTSESRSNSFCLSSTDSGQFTEIEEFQDSYETSADYTHQQCSTFANRFVAYNSSQTQSHPNTAMGVFLRNLKPIPIDPLLDPIFSTCFNCWQFGHRYQECLLSNTHNFCVNCGRMNVLIHSCPRCGRAYHRYRTIKEAKLRKQESASNFGWNFDYDYSNKEASSDDGQQFYTKENLKESCTNLIDEEYYDYSFDESNNYNDDMIIDEDKRSNQSVSNLLRDFLKLLNDVKPWPMEVQNTLLLHFAMERRNQT